MSTGLIAVICLVAHLGAQDPIRSRVVGVRLVVRVLQGSRPVTDLSASDFAITDAGVAQRPDGAVTSGSISMAILVDTSFSVQISASARSHAVAAAEEAASALRTGDRAAAIAISDHSSLLAGPGSDPQALRGALGALQTMPAGFTRQTAMWDGVMYGAALAASADGIPVVLAVTDGRDNISWLSRGETGHLLQRQGIAVDVVGLDSPRTFWLDDFDISPPGPIQLPGDLAHESGGASFDAKDAKLGEKLRARVDELRSSYILTYTPRGVKTDDGWHKVTVSVPGRNVSVKAQPGYYASK
jgi:VWFA-related protein